MTWRARRAWIFTIVLMTLSLQLVASYACTTTTTSVVGPNSTTTICVTTCCNGNCTTICG